LITSSVSDRHSQEEGTVQRTRRFGWTAATSGLVFIVASMLSPKLAGAETTALETGASWSAPMRYHALLAPMPDGGVLVNTAIAVGGVPTGGGAALTDLGPTGSVRDQVPYTDQEIIDDRPVVAPDGRHYYVEHIDGQATLHARGGSLRPWAKPLDGAAGHHLALGVNGQLYDLAGDNVLGYDAASGDQLFPPLRLEQFSSGTYDHLYPYADGLIAYSGNNKVAYVGLDGTLKRGPYELPFDQAGTFFRDSAADPDGSLYVVWYTQALTPNGCLDSNGQTALAKVTPDGLEWHKTLPHVTRCNNGGPYLRAMPSGGVLVSSNAEFGQAVMTVTATGSAGPNHHVATTAGVTTGAFPPHVDTHGNALVAMAFSFDCGLWSDSCAGVEVFRLDRLGESTSLALLKGSPLTDQQSWTISYDPLAITPGRALMSLRHNDGGAIFGTNRTYSLDAFTDPGLSAEYPQSKLWELASSTPTPSLEVKNVQILASPSDPLLTRVIKITPESTAPPLARYEYAWATKRDGRKPGAIQRCDITASTCQLSYRTVSPSTVWNLLIRIVAADGAVGPWKLRPTAIPGRPMLFVFGDSVSSGHQRFLEGKTDCQDHDFAYGKAVWEGMQAQLPLRWRRPLGGYVNVAHSGFSTEHMLNGGRDACGQRRKAEITEVTSKLTNNAGSWNWVLGTAGINDTNWGQVLTDILVANIQGKIQTAEQCEAYTAKWDFAERKDDLLARLQEIAVRLAAADPTATRRLLGYYNVADTGTLTARVPAACSSPIGTAVGQLHDVQRQAVTPTGTAWLDTEPTLGSRDHLLQDLVLSDAIFKKSGWPHPNEDGHLALGELVLRTNGINSP
jgi:hypothetical protein